MHQKSHFDHSEAPGGRAGIQQHGHEINQPQYSLRRSAGGPVVLASTSRPPHRRTQSAGGDQPQEDIGETNPHIYDLRPRGHRSNAGSLGGSPHAHPAVHLDPTAAHAVLLPPHTFDPAPTAHPAHRPTTRRLTALAQYEIHPGALHPHHQFIGGGGGGAGYMPPPAPHHHQHHHHVSPAAAAAARAADTAAMPPPSHPSHIAATYHAVTLNAEPSVRQPARGGHHHHHHQQQQQQPPAAPMVNMMAAAPPHHARGGVQVRGYQAPDVTECTPQCPPPNMAPPDQHQIYISAKKPRSGVLARALVMEASRSTSSGEVVSRC